MTRMILVLVMVAGALGWGVSRGQAAMSAEEQEAIVGGQSAVTIDCGPCNSLEVDGGTGSGTSLCGTVPNAAVCIIRNALCVNVPPGNKRCRGSLQKTQCNGPNCIADRFYQCY